MRHSLYGFRKFVEDMDPSSEKSQDTDMGEKEDRNPQGQDYFGALGDEEGIEWSDLVSTLEGEPWISAHFGLGKPEKEILYKLSPWEIVKGSLTPQGADIRLKPQSRDRSYLHGNRLNKSRYQDTKRYHLGRKELIDFLTKGWTPGSQSSGGMGMGGGMGGMGGGMGGMGGGMGGPGM